MSKQRQIAIATAKKQERELMAAIQRSRRADWQPAPRDPGIRPGGIRDRAMRALAARR